MKKYIRIMIPIIIFIAVAGFILFLPDDIATSGCKKGNHSYTVENLCSECGDVWEYTEGLGYVEYGEGYQFQHIPYDMTVKDLVLPYGYNGRPVVSIFSEACKENAELESVTIPDSVREIGSRAFLNCYNLSEISLPNTPIDIWIAPFGNTAYISDESNWEDGKLYVGKHLVGIKEGITGTLNVKKGTLSVAAYPWMYNEYIKTAPDISVTSVTVPDTVKIIGEGAFTSWKELKNVKLGDGLEQIGYKILSGTAFANEEKHWERGMLYCGRYLLEIDIGIDPVCVIKDGTKLIAAGAFLKNLTLKEVVIPSSVERIELGTFRACEWLTKAELPTRLKYIGDKAFASCIRLEDFDFPEGLEFIGNSAFSGCSALKRAELPDGVKSLGSGAFSNCAALERATLSSGLDHIPDLLFSECVSLENVNIPDNVKSIGRYALYKCNKLASVKLPEGLESIGDSSFSECWTIKELDFPKGLKKIGYGAFSACDSITEISIPGSVTEIGPYAFSSCDKLMRVKLSEGVTHISNHMFSWCKNLAEINIPGSVQSIGKEAFGYCGALKEIVIPNGVKAIEKWLFFNCSSLEKVIIPDTVTSIGERAFENCSSLAEIDFPSVVESIEPGALRGSKFLENENNFENGVLYINTILVAANEKIPDEYTVKEGTTVINYSSFEGNEKLTKIVIPDSVTEIKDSAFKDCASLEDVTLSNNITVIPNDCFMNCEKMTDVELPRGITMISWKAFYGCKSLVSVILPDTVSRVGSWAFANCDNLKNVYIPESVTSMDAGVFQNCVSLEEIVIPDSIVTLNNRMFLDCVDLKTIKLPKNLQSIGFSAFEGCTSLENIELPETVSGIGKNIILDTAYYANVTNWDGKALYLNGWLVGVKDFTSKEYKIKDGTVGVASAVFIDLEILEKLHIPASLRYICGSAFSRCELNEVVFEDPNGWEAVQYSETKAITDLSDPSAAATQLKNNAGHTWVKREE